LWAGPPVLTCSGSTYVGSMAGALLATAELPQLIMSVSRCGWRPSPAC
jgi:hypothetical protein